MLSKVDAFKRIFDMAAAADPSVASPAGQSVWQVLGASGPVWIAGGAAADYDKCGDIDVWFGNNQVTHADAFLKSFKYYQAAIGEKQYDENTHALLLGDAYDPEVGKVIQVLAVGHDILQNLLDTFDISTHRIGYDAPAHSIAGDAWTVPQTPPKILNMNPKTFSRYIKICRRYGHPIDTAELQKHQQMSYDIETHAMKANEIDNAYNQLKKMLHANAYGGIGGAAKIYQANTKKYEPNSLAELYGSTITDSDVAFEHQALLEDHPF